MGFKEIQKIIDIIKKNESVFIASQLGTGYLSNFQKKLLLKAGIDFNKLGKKFSQIDQGFYFGMLAQTLKGNDSFKVKSSQFLKWFEEEYQKPLSKPKQKALDYLKERAFNDVTSIGNTYCSKITGKMISMSKIQQDKLRGEVKDETIKAFNTNKSKAELSSELRKLNEDWSQDFSRISNYVLEEAYAIGRAEQIIEDYGQDAEVYKQTFPGVCKHCEKNYGTPGDEPIVYKLTDLMANGNNIGRKDQEPVIGPAHPWARSILHVKPENSVWSSDKQMFEITRNTQGIKRKSVAKVTIT